MASPASQTPQSPHALQTPQTTPASPASPSSQPRPLRPRPPRRHSSNNGKYNGPTLGAIDEDGGMAPDIPPKAHHRQFARLFHLVPLLYFDKDPEPLVYDFENIIGPGGEKLADVRQNRYHSTRGGWKRLLLLIFVSILLIIGLIVGLVLGLKARSHDSSNNVNSSSQTPPPPSSTFPAGSYSISTFLSTISTACAANPSTWRCYPYTTYNDSATGSLTTFNWIITSTDRSNANFLISSTDNPFALSFANASLTLVDSGSSSEAYTFTVPTLQKVVIPTEALTPDGMTDTCYFNNTVFTAKLYTKMPKTYPAAGTGASGIKEVDGQGWPYAMSAQQTISAGTGVPDCYKSVDGADGDHVGLAALGSGQCACAYQNYGT